MPGFWPTNRSGRKALGEQRVVLRAIAARTDLLAHDPAPEHPRQRNVTMIPHRGARVVVERKRAV